MMHVRRTRCTRVPSGVQFWTILHTVHSLYLWSQFTGCRFCCYLYQNSVLKNWGHLQIGGLYL